MTYPTCDNECKFQGWKEYFAATGSTVLHVSVDPNADLDSDVLAFCHDEQEMIRVAGWLATWEKIQ